MPAFLDELGSVNPIVAQKDRALWDFVQLEEFAEQIVEVPWRAGDVEDRIERVGPPVPR